MTRFIKKNNFYLAPFVFGLILLSSILLTAVAFGEQEEEWRWNNAERIVVIPDIHGAYPAFVRLLQATRLVDSSLNWVGGNTHLVSLGDLLDRGPESRKTMGLLMRLQQQSMQSGGRVHVIAGNHELMNLIGDLRYVSKEEFMAFSSDETMVMRNQEFQKFLSSTNQVFDSEQSAWKYFDTKFPQGYFAHRQAFSPDGEYGRWLLSLPAVIVINDIAFAHGGLPEMIAQTSLSSFNQDYQETLSQYLRLWIELREANILPNDESKDAGDLARSALQNASLTDCVAARKDTCEQLNQGDGQSLAQLDPVNRIKLEKFISLSEKAILGYDTPLWYRGACYCRDIYERPILDASLGQLNARQVIVGHTTTADARVHSLHDDKFTMLDTGMLVKYYSGRPAAMVIENGKQLVQYLDPDEQLTPLKNSLPVSYGLSSAGLLNALREGEIRVIDKPAAAKLGAGGAWNVKINHKGKILDALYYPHDRLDQDQQELAAYELDQLLGFDLVPPTVKREFDNTTGALQLNYKDRISENERVNKGIHIGGWCPINRQFQLTYAWDILTANSGRSADNLFYRKNTGLIYLTDHLQAFGNSKRLPKSLKASTVKMTPQIRQSLRQLNETILQEKLGANLDKKSIQSILSRRDAMLKLFK